MLLTRRLAAFALIASNFLHLTELESQQPHLAALDASHQDM